jgi:lipopolysaccharide export system protein LptC
VYNQITHLITSDTSYTIQRGADSQHGIGFSSNQSFSQFQCLRSCGGITSVLLPER